MRPPVFPQAKLVGLRRSVKRGSSADRRRAGTLESTILTAARTGEVAYFAPSAVALVIIFIIDIFTPREWPFMGYGAMAATVYALGKKFGWERTLAGLLVCTTLVGYILIGAGVLFIAVPPVLMDVGIMSAEVVETAHKSHPTFYMIARLIGWILVAQAICALVVAIVVLVRRFKKTNV